MGEVVDWGLVVGACCGFWEGQALAFGFLGWVRIMTYRPLILLGNKKTAHICKFLSDNALVIFRHCSVAILFHSTEIRSPIHCLLRERNVTPMAHVQPSVRRNRVQVYN